MYLAKEIVLHVNSGELPDFRKVLKKLYNVLDPPELLRNIRAGPSVDFRGAMECLEISISASSSDPRDKVFAILSLLEPQLRKYIPVDYALDYQHVFGLAVMLCIAELQDLRLLRFAQLPVTSDCITACSFSLDEFLNFLRDRVDTDSFLGESTFFSEPEIVTVMMMSTETHSLEYVNGPNQGSITTVEQSSQWFPPRQILPRIQVRAHMIDISTGHLNNRGFSFLDLIVRQASGVFAEYTWLKHMFQIHRSEMMDIPEHSRAVQAVSDHGSPCEINWGDVIQCASEISQFHRFHREGLPGSTSDSDTFESIIGRIASRISGPPLFRTHYSVGSSASHHLAGDHVFAIYGATEPYLLRPIDSNKYRVVGKCYLWAAKSLHYWNPGTYKGLWRERPMDLGERTRTIEIY